MRFQVCLAIVVALHSALNAVVRAAADDPLRLNQIQVVGTHNSYHLRPAEAMLKTAIAVRKDAKEWDYSRQPLDEQLDQGVRSLELDLHLSADGWQVMHVPSFDPGTTVRTFTEALQVVRAWSDAHPGHVPVSFLMELKEEGFRLNRAYRRPARADIERLDDEIRSVFPPEKLLAPDDVRRGQATLLAATQAHGWPKLKDCAGKAMFILHEQGEHRAAYLEGHPALEGRAMFVESELDQPHSAVLIRNNPAEPQLDELARAGYLIRTRADSQGGIDPKLRAKALAGGAHVLSTDFPHGEIEAERAFGFPQQAPARVNPVTGPKDRAGETLSEPLR